MWNIPVHVVCHHRLPSSLPVTNWWLRVLLKGVAANDGISYANGNVQGLASHFPSHNYRHYIRQFVVDGLFNPYLEVIRGWVMPAFVGGIDS